MHSKEDISITVQLNLEDYVAYNRAYVNMRFKWRIWFYIIIFGAVLINTVRSSMDVFEKRPIFYLLLGLPVVIFGLMTLLQRTLNKARFKRIFESDASLRSEYEYTFSKESFRVKSSTADIKYFWQDVYEVREAKLFFYIFIGINKALIIPKSALDNELIVSRFIEILQENITDPKKLKLL